ncbi:hybrid sensor histidine kinase/response regulator [Prosthecobacter sp.]|uniref:ATP-binding response regulator n=1 Tax=Prosthecobacter sp. TaxID=1965333 RepID=UPI002487B83C|nr:hybrid sensor histidine kinase/response regulator [Prosthecobacter sp.]MDI1312261.1 response regulator [Prosthecobacter sp.]
MEQRTLLVVDENAKDRGNTISQMRCDLNFSYQVTEAGTVAEALAAVAKIRPDCVVIDQKLPDASGHEFLLSVSDLQGHLPFPVIILASAGDQESAVAMMKAGAMDYLVKANTAADSVRMAVNNAIYKFLGERKFEEQQKELKLLYNETTVSNDALRAANASKDDFLAMLSHELRTPLTPVLSLVSATVNDKSLSSDLRETFSIIQRNVELEARLIDDLLDLTQISSGRLKIDKSPLDINQCIEAALDICREGFAEKRIIVHKELEAEKPIVMGEFSRLNQVFWNLLKNAIKYTSPHGHVTLTTANDSHNCVVEIRDDGRGIEPSQLPSIFGTFQPIKPRPTDTGIGLGLAIARAIVEGHGGEISAQSEGKDQGAVFRIRLPLAQTEPTADEVIEGPAANATRRGRSILVVEDHDDTRRALSRVLQRKGYEVTVAGSVAAAVQQFYISAPDLVICDIGLSDGTGWDLMKKLHQQGPVRAIAVSGYGMEHDVKKSREAGFIEHMTKPINISNLENTIAATLQIAPRL